MFQEGINCLEGRDPWVYGGPAESDTYGSRSEEPQRVLCAEPGHSGPDPKPGETQQQLLSQPQAWPGWVDPQHKVVSPISFASQFDLPGISSTPWQRIIKWEQRLRSQTGSCRAYWRLLNTNIQQITFADLMDFIKQIMNWAASPLASKRAFQRGCTKWKVLYRKKCGEREILSKGGKDSF